MDIKYLEDLVEKTLSKERFNHTQGVIKLSCELAQNYGVDKNKAYISALLHDITKEQPKDIQLQTIKNSDIIINNVFENNPALFHSLTAYIMAKDKLDIKDTDILNAIRYHTTSRSSMSMLEKIIYLADATSYERSYPECEFLRNLCFTDINKCLLEVIKFTITDVIKKGRPLAQETIDCYQELVLSRD